MHVLPPAGGLLQSDIGFHLIFMDIMMEGRNGIETGQEIYSRNRSAKIRYVTNFGQYCMDAVNTAHAFDFLEKPVSAQALGVGFFLRILIYQRIYRIPSKSLLKNMRAITAK